MRIAGSRRLLTYQRLPETQIIEAARVEYERCRLNARANDDENGNGRTADDLNSFRRKVRAALVHFIQRGNLLLTRNSTSKASETRVDLQRLSGNSAASKEACRGQNLGEGL